MSPGPAHYKTNSISSINQHDMKFRKTTFGTSSKLKFSDKKVPGPGEYKHQDFVGTLNNYELINPKPIKNKEKRTLINNWQGRYLLRYLW